MAMKKIH